MKLPQDVKTVMARLEQAGFAVYVVGGAVRDWLLGRPQQDFDLATTARPAEVAALFAPAVSLLGARHGTVTVKTARRRLEITTFRTDGAYSDRRHPDAVQFVGGIREDLARRDFTINAMAWNGTLIDPFGGAADLKAQLVRAVGDPHERFTEDALRIIRAVRFALQLGFTIEAETLQAAEQLAPTLLRVSPERIGQELVKCFVHPARLFEEFRFLLQALFPAGIFSPALGEFAAVASHPGYLLGALLRSGDAAVLKQLALPRAWTQNARQFGRLVARKPTREQVADAFVKSGAPLAEAIIQFTALEWQEELTGFDFTAAPLALSAEALVALGIPQRELAPVIDALKRAVVLQAVENAEVPLTALARTFIK